MNITQESSIKTLQANKPTIKSDKDRIYEFFLQNQTIAVTSLDIKNVLGIQDLSKVGRRISELYSAGLIRAYGKMTTSTRTYTTYVLCSPWEVQKEKDKVGLQKAIAYLKESKNHTEYLPDFLFDNIQKQIQILEK